MENTENEQNEESLREEAEILATRVKLLFGFCFELVPKIELLKRTLSLSNDKASTALAAAPLLTAAGIDYEQKHWEADMRKRRAEALVNLIKVLDETEKERIEMEQQAKNKAASRDELARILGL